jgi:hypothetical protein
VPCSPDATTASRVWPPGNNLKGALVVLALAASGSSAQTKGEDPLPSWRDGPAKKAILAFVSDVTTIGSPDYALVEERITTFDNDETLWTEQPMYAQFAFAGDRGKALAPEHPEWKQTHRLKPCSTGRAELSWRAVKNAFCS